MKHCLLENRSANEIRVKNESKIIEFRSLATFKP